MSQNESPQLVTHCQWRNFLEKVNEDDLDLSLEILQAWAPEMQQAINQKIQMKYLPRLTFYADESSERILKIENLLSTLVPAEGKSENKTTEDDN